MNRADWTMQAQGDDVMLQSQFAVNTDGVQLRQVRVVGEQLSLVGRGADLLDWSADKYGRPTSYSRIDSPANVVILNVDATCKCK